VLSHPTYSRAVRPSSNPPPGRVGCFHIRPIAKPALPIPHPEGWSAFTSDLQHSRPSLEQFPTRKGGVVSHPTYTQPALPIPHPEGWGAFTSDLYTARTPNPPPGRVGCFHIRPIAQPSVPRAIPHPEGWGSFTSDLQQSHPSLEQFPTRKGGVFSHPTYSRAVRPSSNSPPFRVGDSGNLLSALVGGSETTPPSRVGDSGSVLSALVGPNLKLLHPSGWGIPEIRSGRPNLKLPHPPVGDSEMSCLLCRP
jgi:hypothetical protein